MFPFELTPERPQPLLIQRGEPSGGCDDVARPRLVADDHLAARVSQR